MFSMTRSLGTRWCLEKPSLPDPHLIEVDDDDSSIELNGVFDFAPVIDMMFDVMIRVAQKKPGPRYFHQVTDRPV